jgi:xanthine dehydrogenase accessory factor
MKNVYLQLIDHESDKHLPVVATVVRTRGSAPQKPGSSALINGKGLFSGTVGGGAVEGKIHQLGIERFQTRKSGYFHFNLKNDISKKEEAICGGQITILLDADPGRHLDVFRKISESVSHNIPGVLVTLVTAGKDDEAVIDRYWVEESSPTSLPDELAVQAMPVIMEMLATADQTDFREICPSDSSSYIFLEPVFPPLKLVIAGAGHIGRSLSHFGRILGFEVTVIDDRPEYANHENIPDADNFIVRNIGDASRELSKGQDTYMVIVTRGHKDDAEALRACIGSDLAYLGMIGSRKKIDAVRDEFFRNGWATPEQWAKLYSPIGLEINSVTVEEISVSIAAQIIMVKNSRKKKKSGCPA